MTIVCLKLTNVYKCVRWQACLWSNFEQRFHGVPKPVCRVVNFVPVVIFCNLSLQIKIEQRQEEQMSAFVVKLM